MKALKKRIKKYFKTMKYETKKELCKNWRLYVLIILPVVYLIIFKYSSMYWLQIAFKDYDIAKGINGSKWVGLEHFKRFVTSYQFWKLLKNTLLLSFYQLVASFPLPIILALSINYARSKFYKKTAQMITYAPHFISVVVIVGMMYQFFGTRFGLVNSVIKLFGGSPIDFMGNPRSFRHMYVWSSVWQNVGYSAIIYIAALAAIPPELHEAAVVDGASKLKRMIHVDLPGLLPTAVIILIMNVGKILNIGFEKALLLQNPMNVSQSEIIATFVYKIGLTSTMPNFSYPAAIGLFQSFIAFILVITVNKISRKFSETSLW
ncbi:MAG: ABC transporter permease subunit [Vallitalea sp.]|jgi:multiple sugar transport system permease protein/putative aldouronate transport system permease protein|nr:ABC transporter permease subunit [Vallitalea sp.]